MTGTTPLEYARWRETALGAVTERLERAAVLDLAGPLAGRDVLDVGCGDGTYALAAARAGARVTAADRSAAVVEAARCNSADAGLPLDLHVADALTLPFPGGALRRHALGDSALLRPRSTASGRRDGTRSPPGRRAGPRRAWALERVGRMATPACLGRIDDVARGPVLDPGRAAGAAAPGSPHPRARARSRVLPTPRERSEAAGAGRSASGRRDASRCCLHRDRGQQTRALSEGASGGPR